MAGRFEAGTGLGKNLLQRDWLFNCGESFKHVVFHRIVVRSLCELIEGYMVRIIREQVFVLFWKPVSFTARNES